MKRICVFVTLFTLFVALGWCNTQSANELYAKFSKLSTEQLMDIGKQFYADHQGEQALVCYSVVIGRYRDQMSKHEKERCASALNNRGCIYKFVYFDYSRAYEDMSQALEYCEREQHTRLEAIVCANMGTLLNDYSRQYASGVVKRQAQDMFHRSFEGAIKSENWELLATSFANLVEFNHDEELLPFKALFSEKIPDTIPNMRYARLLYRGVERLQQGDYSGARNYFEQQKQAIDWHDTPERPLIIATMNVAATYSAEGNYQVAEQQLLRAEKIALEHDVKDLEFQICQDLSECYQKMNRPEQARTYQIAYLEKKDSLMRANQLVSVGEQNFISELRLEEEKVKSLTAKHRVQNAVLWLSGLILLILLSFVLVVRSKNKQLKVRNRALYERMQAMMETQERQQAMLKASEAPQPEPETELEPDVEEMPSPDAPAQEKYSSSRLGDAEKEQILQRIQEAMNTPELICKQGFTILQLAQYVGSNSTYVSQVINEKYGYTFSVLLGNSRIIEACRRMRDQEYSQLTIEAISQSVGFKSRGTFISAFKRVVGITPSEYLKVAQNSAD